MARKTLIEKKQRIEKTIARETPKREVVKAQMKKARTGEISMAEALELMVKLSKMPRNGSKIRLKNRCTYDGRPQGYMRAFGMNRVLFRKLASEGKLPGVVKSSW